MKLIIMCDKVVSGVMFELFQVAPSIGFGNEVKYAVVLAIARFYTHDACSIVARFEKENNQSFCGMHFPFFLLQLLQCNSGVDWPNHLLLSAIAVVIFPSVLMCCQRIFAQGNQLQLAMRSILAFTRCCERCQR